MARGLAIIFVFVLLMSACGQAPEHKGKPKYGSWGVDTSEMDPSIRPGDDFFAYSIGSWLVTAQIPPDRTYAGVDLVINDQLQQDLQTIIMGAAAQHAAQGEPAQQVGDLYASFMNEAAAESKGVEPIRGDLAAIDRASDKAGLSSPLAALNSAGGTTPFPVDVTIDPIESTRYIAELWQGGLSIGDRNYYLDSDQQFVDLRAKFVAHVQRLLSLAGYTDAAAQAQQVMALETKLAQAHWPLEDERDVQKTRTVMSRADVERLATGVPLRAMLDAQRLPATVDFQVGMPEVVAKTAQLFQSESLETWKAYLRYQVLHHYSPFLSKAFVDEVFDFYSRQLNGLETQRPRWMRGVSLVNSELGDAVGQLYIADHFPAETRAQVLNLVDALRKAYAARIAMAAWMSPTTKKEAQAKLAAMVPKIGYPDKWKSYKDVTISPDDLIDDVRATESWSWNDQISRLSKPIDRAEWNGNAQTNNAFYSPSLNDITFPAGILQAPNFDPNADPAANYGAIGATIGHEMSHGFDDQGRQRDASGALRDWWTPQDAQRYNAEAAKLVAQFDAYEPQPGIHINGAQTLGENIADLAGLRIAYDAYKLSLGGKEAPVIDGLTGDQRFFLAYAASWKGILRPEAERDQLLSDVHSPSKYRVNGVVRNMDEWYAAFDVKEGDALYLSPEHRVRIW